MGTTGWNDALPFPEGVPMKLRALVLSAALLAACAPTGTAPTPGASTGPSSAPGVVPSVLPSTAGAVLAQGDFVPSALTLKVDGAAVAIQPRGYVSENTTKTLGASL